MKTFSLTVLSLRLAVCRLPAETAIPKWARQGDFWSVTRTAAELSLVYPEDQVPADVRAERGWRVLRVAGPLDFGLVGVLASLAGTLAEAGISIFVLSTYDTDYLLVQAERLDTAVAALRTAGHTVGHKVA